MPEPIDAVRQLLSSFSSHHDAIEAINALTTDDMVWSNSGLPDAVGREAVLKMVEGMHTAIGADGMKIEILNIAANGDVVLTERIDRAVRADGTEIVSVDVMGTFELRDGKISAWRDYFDLAGFMGRMQAALGG